MTTAVGILLPIGLALQLPWRDLAGNLVSREDVIKAYQKVDAAKHLARLGGGCREFRMLTELRLASGDMDALVERKLNEVDNQLRRRWNGYDEWPADAQLALLSWAWAAGAWAAYPKMSAALAREDFDAAALESDTKTRLEEKLSDGRIVVVFKEIGTQIKRNAQQRMCLRNAEVVAREGLDRNELFWPKELGAPPPLRAA